MTRELLPVVEVEWDTCDVCGTFDDLDLQGFAIRCPDHRKKETDQ